MKKIKHIKDIEREKLRLRVQQLEQEKQLQENWQNLKHNLKPGNLLRSKLADLTHSKPGEGHWLDGLLHLGAGYLGRYTGTRVEDTLLKGVDFLSQKINRKTRR